MSDAPVIDFKPATIPTITREGGGGRLIKWEETLSPLKEKDQAGNSFLAWTYEKKAGATSRVAAIRNRLTEAVPEENWTLAVRENEAPQPEGFGVYVRYNGQFTPEDVAKNAADRKSRSDKIKAARAAAAAAEEASPEVPAQAPTQTPAQKVAAAKANAAKK